MIRLSFLFSYHAAFDQSAYLQLFNQGTVSHMLTTVAQNVRQN